MSAISDGVSQVMQNLADTVNAYDHNLFLEMVPPDQQQHLIDKTKVLRIVDDRTKTVIMYASMIETPQDILARLWTSDQKNGDPYELMLARNAAVEALQNQKYIEEMEEKKEFALFVAKNQKSRWRHDGRMRDDEFRDLGPVRKQIS